MSFDRQLRSRENPYCNCARLRGLSAGYEGQILYGSWFDNELLAAQQEYRLNKLEKQWLAPHLVILDELGYVPFSKIGAELLFQFCSSRYERAA